MRIWVGTGVTTKAESGGIDGNDSRGSKATTVIFAPFSY